MSATTTEPLSVGLVGAGTWATMFHAPVMAAGPETRLSGIWARRHSAAQALADRHGALAFTSFEELLDHSDAVAFAVPPDVQASLALDAVAAGKPVLLEKPLALDIEAARTLARAIEEHRVGSLVVFMARFAQPVRDLLGAVEDTETIGARVWWLSGALADGPFARSPWRNQHGVLFDLGPHALDLATAALGPVERVTAEQSARGWISVLLTHRSGARSDVSLCAHAGGNAAGIEIATSETLTGVDVLAAFGSSDAGGALRHEFAEIARTGHPHPCDAGRALEIQELLSTVIDAIDV